MTYSLCYSHEKQLGGAMSKTLTVLTCALGLDVFTVPELASHAGVVRNTVSTVLDRYAEHFERATVQDNPATGTQYVGDVPKRGRPAVRWQIKDRAALTRAVENAAASLHAAAAAAQTPSDARSVGGPRGAIDEAGAEIGAASEAESGTAAESVMGSGTGGHVGFEEPLGHQKQHPQHTALNDLLVELLDDDEVSDAALRIGEDRLLRAFLLTHSRTLTRASLFGGSGPEAAHSDAERWGRAGPWTIDRDPASGKDTEVVRPFPRALQVQGEQALDSASDYVGLLLLAQEVVLSSIEAPKFSTSALDGQHRSAAIAEVLGDFVKKRHYPTSGKTHWALHFNALESGAGGIAQSGAPGLGERAQDVEAPAYQAPHPSSLDSGRQVRAMLLLALSTLALEVLGRPDTTDAVRRGSLIATSGASRSWRDEDLRWRAVPPRSDIGRQARAASGLDENSGDVAKSIFDSACQLLAECHQDVTTDLKLAYLETLNEVAQSVHNLPLLQFVTPSQMSVDKVFGELGDVAWARDEVSKEVTSWTPQWAMSLAHTGLLPTVVCGPDTSFVLWFCTTASSRASAEYQPVISVAREFNDEDFRRMTESGHPLVRQDWGLISVLKTLQSIRTHLATLPYHGIVGVDSANSGFGPNTDPRQLFSPNVSMDDAVVPGAWASNLSPVPAAQVHSWWAARLHSPVLVGDQWIAPDYWRLRKSRDAAIGAWVYWFSTARGYGLLVTDIGAEVYFGANAVEANPLGDLTGQRVEVVLDAGGHTDRVRPLRNQSKSEAQAVLDRARRTGVALDLGRIEREVRDADAAGNEGDAAELWAQLAGSSDSELAVVAMNRLASLDYRRGDLVSARTWLARARHYDGPHQPQTLNRLGLVDWKRGQSSRARYWWTLAARTGAEPVASRAAYRLGILEYDEARPLGAAKWWRYAAESDDLKTRGLAAYRLGCLVSDAGDIDEARRWWLLAVERREADTWQAAAVNLGVIAFDIGEYENAHHWWSLVAKTGSPEYRDLARRNLELLEPSHAKRAHRGLR